MKKLLLVLLLTTLTQVSKADEGDLGLGIIAGGPTGFSGEYRLEGSHSLDFAAAWTTISHVGTHLHATYLFNQPSFGNIEDVPVYWYFGLGARAIFLSDREDKHKNDRVYFGPRAPVGAYITSTDLKFKFFAEAALTMNVLPSSGLDLDLAIGARYYF